MNRKSHLLLIFTSSLLLIGLVGCLWPYYKYFVDPDAISYLVIVKSYLANDYVHAVNAFWSPLGCWLTVLLVKITDWELFASAIIVNTAGALFTLIVAQVLFYKFRKDVFENWCFAVCNAFFWSYIVYIQSFTDVWQCFFLLAALLLLLKDNLQQKPLYWILLGLIGALAYFSKAYSFYFFPLMVLVVLAIKIRPWERRNYKIFFKISITVIGIMLLSIAPWIYLIHEKYGIWTSSTAGTLNLSWWLEGTQIPRKDISVLIPPPPYKGSIFYFEDPLLVQGDMVHFWDSPRLFLKFIVRICYNAIQWVISCNNLSPFYFFIWLFTVLFVVQRKHSLFNGKLKQLVVIFLLFPLPYWIITFDNGRYLWFTIPLSMIIGLYLFEQHIAKYFGKMGQKFFISVFFLSFLVHPLINMQKNFKAGFAEYEMAQQLKEMKINGAFVSNLSYQNGQDILHGIAYYSESPWYCHTLNVFSSSEILNDAKRYHVQYYYYFYFGTGSDYELKDENGSAYPELTKGAIKGMKVFYLGF